MLSEAGILLDLPKKSFVKALYFVGFLYFLVGASVTYSQTYSRDDTERAFASPSAFSSSIRLAATGPYRDEYIDGLIKFPNLSACLEPGVVFVATRPLHWAEITTRAEHTLCGFWLAQELGSLEKMKTWADAQGFPARIRERVDGNPRIGTIRIPIVNVPELQIGRRSFFSPFRRNDSFVGTWVAGTDDGGIFDDFRFELPTAK